MDSMRMGHLAEWVPVGKVLSLRPLGAVVVLVLMAMPQQV